MDAAISELAPDGVLRGGVVVAPAAAVSFAIEKDGRPSGIPVDLLQALADEVRVRLALSAFPNSGELTEAVARGTCDAAFMPQDAERATKVAFGPASYIVESTFLVPAGSTIGALAEANFPGARAIAIANTTTARSARRFLTQGSVNEVRGVGEFIELAAARKADLFALSRDAFVTLLLQLPGARVLAGNFQEVPLAIAVPKKRPAALELATAFLQRAKASGIVRRAFDRAGFKDAEVAP
jgi:polar amino acid transport system substrate-binding protein